MKESHKKYLKITGLVLVGMIIGGALNTPEPKVETKVETKTVTVEKVVEKTPKSCVEALTIYRTALGKIGDGLTGIQNGDNAPAFDAANYMNTNSSALAVSNGDCLSKQ